MSRIEDLESKPPLIWETEDGQIKWILRGANKLRNVGKLQMFGGVIQNLSTYREAPTFFGELASPIPTSPVIAENVAFDIERIVEYLESKICPFKYSMMIDGYYSPANRPFTLGEFKEIVSKKSGFAPDGTQEMDGFAQFVNPTQNIFVNYDERALYMLGKVCIGVVQLKPVHKLSLVTEQVVPYGVEIFNDLNPGRQVEEYIVSKSIFLAELGDQMNVV